MSAKTTPVRITARLEALIQRAAAYEGRTVSQFVADTLQKAANAVIQEHELLRLNPLQSRAFVERLLHPPDPNESLQRAAEEYRQTVARR